MRFKLSPSAKKYILSLDKDAVSRIYTDLREITQDPPIGDIKRMQGHTDLYRLRVGDYRLLCRKHNNELLVEKIAPRGQAYK
jgi:mRNA interferase RelE/StbE